ncbi:tetratricopeptide repeat protein 19 homolog, mitochondrial [Chelonus insularis]|uniref:tetratricopeptide repeat protein 19 homolog, mitochondrial n=1 Tax=Chelonus insularis TaxID=460826 RepID=UPI00158C828D|nr:tetratricopeptide repeat protein 19 homolog, mitochondrial [Chelonus insularis]XP_034948293.1 tetratricopeptide repeat protein 19 homolog, mitochondrial [Chelonus insularis]XP_034948302.1 tetratricopeptide repeat protein 19 homolog, mitochondrial [Chelonus insularis]XP_034948311.1 tetratricopeptide repeat protein 19 homolog, mitochondrial [Chelonus insularis]
MAARYFLRSLNLLRSGRNYFYYDKIQTNFINLQFIRLKQWRQPKSWSFNNKFKQNLIIASSGLWGLFKFGDDEENDAESELIMLIKRSVLLIQKDEFKKAEQMLHVALRQAQMLQNEQGITYIYYVMADLAFQVGEIEKAQNLYKSVMQRLLSSGTPQDDIKIVHISLKIARLYEQDGNPSMAENGYQFCIQTMNTHLKDNPDDEETLILWATLKDWYAKMLTTQSRYPEALDNFLEAYKVCSQVNGKDHEWSLLLMNDLGMVLSVLGQHDDALKYLEEAVEIGKSVKDLDLTEMYINLGFVYLSKSLYKEAHKACMEGLKYAKENGKDDCLEEANQCLSAVKGLF